MCILAGLEAVATQPSAETREGVQLVLKTTNLHPIKMMNHFDFLLKLGHHHTDVFTTLKAIASEKASEMNEIMSLKAYYIYYILRTFIREGKEAYVRKCVLHVCICSVFVSAC